MVGQVALVQDLIRGFRVSTVSIISPVLHTHLNLHTDLARKTNGQNLETFTHQFSFVYGGTIDREVLALNVNLLKHTGYEMHQ